MALSVEAIAAVVGEIAPVLNGGWVQKVFQPTPHAITLEIRTPGQTLALHLSADPETARLHLLSGRLPNPPTPPPFCQYLRAHIQGARIESIEQVPGDRIVHLRMSAREGPCSLIAELTGRRADLLFVNAGDTILAALRGGREKSGAPYHLPAPRTRTAHAADFEPSSPASEKEAFPVSASIERRYHRREDELALARERQTRLATLRKEIKKRARRIDGLRADLEKASRYRDYARYGELLKANLGAMTKGQDTVTVVDYFDPTLPEVTIPLEPSKSPQGNMDDYFRKHRKHLAAEREIRPRLETNQRDLEALRMELTAIERGTWEPPLSEPGLSKTVRPLSPVQPSAFTAQHSKRSGPFRRFTSSDGLPIYVGRNARENEELTFKVARSDDLWLHAQGTPGSHVVVRLDKGAELLPETLRDAAVLALLYSDLKKSGKGEVIYTRRKYVRKVKGQAPGTVTVTQEKTIFVTLDKPRLDALKERSG